MASFIEIIRFAGWVAIIAGVAFVIPDFWQNAGEPPLIEVVARSAVLAVTIAFMILLFGAVIYQSLNVLFTARDILISGTLLAFPVVLLFMASTAISEKLTFDTVINRAVAFIIFWPLLTLFAFFVMYVFPRIASAVPFGK